MLMTATLWVALGAILAALITREIKISEFRQAWIDGLRADLSEYMSKAHEWVDRYQAMDSSVGLEEQSELAAEMDRLKYDSWHVLRRVELRFKVDDEEANALIQKLRDLLNPGSVPAPDTAKTWNRLADEAVIESRTLLKEEWENTKNPLRKLFTKARNRLIPKPDGARDGSA